VTVFGNSEVKLSRSATGAKSDDHFMLHTAYRRITYNTVTRIGSAMNAGNSNRPDYTQSTAVPRSFRTEQLDCVLNQGTPIEHFQGRHVLI